jgi:hypothetical protein
VVEGAVLGHGEEHLQQRVEVARRPLVGEAGHRGAARALFEQQRAATGAEGGVEGVPPCEEFSEVLGVDWREGSGDAGIVVAREVVVSA